VAVHDDLPIPFSNDTADHGRIMAAGSQRFHGLLRG
jgi:hypothetical protein